MSNHFTERCQSRSTQSKVDVYLLVSRDISWLHFSHTCVALRRAISKQSLEIPLSHSRCDQSIIDAKTRILNIITSRPIVTMIKSVKLNQPITIADVPTPDNTLPLPKSCAIMLAATDAVCCHNTDTNTKIEAMKMIASAIWLTGRLGKGLTSRSEPSLSSSSCHPGNVARRRRQMKANIVAMILKQYVSWPISKMEVG